MEVYRIVVWPHLKTQVVVQSLKLDLKNRFLRNEN